MPARPLKESHIIGWREWISLPGLGIPFVKAKIDTGARSSALHAFDIVLFKKEGRRMVRFKVHPEQRNATETIHSEALLLEERYVKSSTGKAQLRPVIETEVELLGQRWLIELTLTNRDSMGFRMLLGRQGVRGRFLVDPSTSFRGGRRKVRKRKTTSRRATAEGADDMPGGDR